VTAANSSGPTFERVDLRAVIRAKTFPRARKQAIKLRIDLGQEFA